MAEQAVERMFRYLLYGLHRDAALGLDDKVARAIQASPHKINTRDYWGNVPLAYSCQYGKDIAAKLLIAGGASVDLDRCLYFATRSARCEIVRLLLDRGANVNAAFDRDVTALHVAVAKRDLIIAEILLRAGADPNAMTIPGGTPLYITAIQGDFDAVSLLIMYNADTDLRTANGETAHELAEDERHVAICQLLNSKGGATDN